MDLSSVTEHIVKLEAKLDSLGMKIDGLISEVDTMIRDGTPLHNFDETHFYRLSECEKRKHHLKATTISIR